MKALYFTIFYFVCLSVSGNAQSFSVLHDTVYFTPVVWGMNIADTVIAMDTSAKITWKVTDCNFPVSWTSDMCMAISDDCNSYSGTHVWDYNNQTGLPHTCNIYPADTPGFYTLSLYFSVIPPPSCYYLTAKLTEEGSNYTRNITFATSACLWPTALPLMQAGRMHVIAYPNPATNEIILTCDNAVAVKTNVAVYNAAGKTVASTQLPENNEWKLNLSDIAPGLYFVRFTDMNGLITGSTLFTRQ